MNGILGSLAAKKTVTLFIYYCKGTSLVTRAIRQLELSFRSHYQIFFYFFGHDGLRDKPSGHELSSLSL